MRVVKCSQHGEKYTIPIEDREFLSGKYHDEIERCHVHHEQNPACRFFYTGDTS